MYQCNEGYRFEDFTKEKYITCANLVWTGVPFDGCVKGKFLLRNWWKTISK